MYKRDTLHIIRTIFLFLDKMHTVPTRYNKCLIIFRYSKYIIFFHIFCSLHINLEITKIGSITNIVYKYFYNII